MVEFAVILLVTLSAILYVWALFDVLYRIYKKDASVELYWIFIILFLPLVGSMVYFQYKGSQNRRNSRFRKRT